MYSMRRQRQQRRTRAKTHVFRIILIVLLGGLIFNYLRPLPHVAASMASLSDSPQNVKLNWPSEGSAALGAQGFGILNTHGPQTPRPTASVAKIITSLAILEKKPLTKGQQGPTITLSKQDVDLYNHYFSIGGSYVKVEAGEQITEYQALEAILLPSANNMADSLAIWAFGSMDAYHEYARQMLQKHSLTNTIVDVDASGMSPATKSTPGDLMQLGQLALENEVITEIVQMKDATIPVHGIIYSANSRYNANGIMGIKTGLTDEAGGCYLFASTFDIEGKPVTVVGMIMDQHDLNTAIKAAAPLVNSAKKYFSVKTPVKAGEAFATLTTPWLSSAKVIAKEDISLVSWNGLALTPNVQLSTINRSLPIGAQVGTAIITSGHNKATTPLILQEAISGPSWQWRLKRF
jgi:serine-type D-Ala-D-Ala carboxypeptidase (penicillin-binding protein 5/6)